MDDHTDDLARTDAPERIWVDFAESPSGAMIGSVYTSDLGDIPYILATALAASPEGQALLREAEARGRDAGIDDAIEAMQDKLAHWGETDDLLDWIAPGRTLIAEAAALRAGRGETK